MQQSSEIKPEITLHVEEVLNKLPKNGIHEGQISLTHGFIPHSPLKQSLPPEYQAWDDLQRRLHQLVAAVAEREALKQLPLLDAANPETLPNEYLSRAASILGNLAHAYYYNERLGSTQAEDPLPPSVLIPWEQVNARIGRRFGQGDATLKAFRSCYDVFLSNFKVSNPLTVIDGGENNLKIQGSDLELINYATATQAERGNNITFILAELRFAAALKPMLKALQAVAAKNDRGLIDAFKSITHVLEKVTEALDYLTPNQYSKHYVDQTVWTKTAATFDGIIPGGHSGLSGSEFPMFQTIDIFFERPSFETPFGKAFAKKLDIQPSAIFDFFDAFRCDLKQNSLRSYVESSDNSCLKKQYQAMFDTFSKMMTLHRMKAFGYLQINFLNGRPLTNGGNTGERNIYSQLKLADEERVSNYRHIPHDATKVSVRLLGQNAGEIILDTTNTGLDFKPGDRCMIIPQNNAQHVDVFLKKQNRAPQTLIVLNVRWKLYFQEELGLDIEQLPLIEFLKYVALEDFKDKKLPQEIDSNLFQPVHPRQYSQSPMGNGKIRLTVGKHAYEQEGLQMEGVASSFLLRDPNTRFPIKKVAARHFHLPDDPETPILMFAAGTGIAPFMGFINERTKTSHAQKNWLFYSVRDQDSFYYGDELEVESRNNRLNLSVAFTRSMDATHKSKRIDALIAENAMAIASMIMEKGAHVFVCGGSGFADTVMQSLTRALRIANQENVAHYIDTMVAEHRYKIDVYSQPSQDKPPAFYRSEIATHNKQDNCWIIFNKIDQAGEIIERNVYDLNKLNFAHFHPGGQKILLVNGGTDGTAEYRIIGHHLDQQIEALLMSCKIGVVAMPAFVNQEEETLYNKSLFCLDALTKIENNLVITNNLFLDNPAPYLWRNTLIGFFGRESNGSLQMVLRAFEELCQLMHMPKQNFESFYAQLSQCAVFIFEKTRTIACPAEIQQLRGIYEEITNKTTAFVKAMKKTMCGIANAFETKASHAAELQQSLDGINELIKKLMIPTSHLCSQFGMALGEAKKRKTFFESAAACPFAKFKKDIVEPVAFNSPLANSTAIALPVIEDIHPVVSSSVLITPQSQVPLKGSRAASPFSMFGQSSHARLRSGAASATACDSSSSDEQSMVITAAAEQTQMWL